MDGQQPQPETFRTRWPGNAAINIREDSKICAVAGWDGNIRLYSTKFCKPLGTLAYHRTSCQTVCFARLCKPPLDDNDASSLRDWEDTKNWLASGGKDGRIALWKLMDFTKK
jgi:WD40 repeat protein